MRSGPSRVVGALAVVLLGTPVEAQYLLPRANRERTGRLSTPVPVEAPRPVWQSFVGGTLGPGSPAYLDAAGDGTTDLVILAGGVLSAKRPSDIETWAARSYDLRLLVGTFDLDGNGEPEVVAIGEAGRLVVVSGTTGEVLFDESVVGGIGTGTRVRDLDGDGILDLYVPGAGCGAGGNNDGVALSFAAGVRNPVELWRLEPTTRDHDCGNYDVFVDLEGDGTPEVVALGYAHMYAYDSTTGALRFGSDDIGRTPYGLAQCTPVDVQGDGDEELVCFSNGAYQPAANARRVFAVDFDDARGVLTLLWTEDVADLVLDRNAFVSESVSDLDADGLPEVVHSFFDGASGTWTTFLRDAATGAQIDTWDDAWVTGLVDLDADGRPEVLLSDEAGIEALRFDDGLESLWRVDGLQVARTLDRSQLSTRVLGDRIIETATGDGPAIALQHVSANGELDSIRLIQRSTSDPAEIARYDAPDGSVFTRFVALDGSPDPDAVFVAGTSESRLVTLAADLSPTNRIEDPKFPVLGARHGGVPNLAGGLASFPLAADADGDGVSELVLADARSVVSFVDARDASVTREPIASWSVPRGGYAAFFDAGASGLGTVVQTGGALEAFDSSGASLWQTDLLDYAAGDRFYRDLLPFPLAAGGDAILAYRLRTGAGSMEAATLSSVDGSLLWPDWVPLGLAGDGVRSAAYADVDGDGSGEIVTSPGGATLAAYDASDGSIVRSREGPGLLLPVVVDLDGDGSSEILETGFSTLSAVDASFSELWRVPGETSLRSYGALALCPGPIWVTGLIDGPRLRAYDLTNGSLLHEVVLAGGGLFATEGDARAAGNIPGSIRAVTVAPSAGDPTDDIALVGASEGHLYAVGACDLDLRWAVEMGGAVETAVPADTDGDGEAEIVLMAADGYVHGLGVPRVEPPGTVLDVDPPCGIPDEDVDEVEVSDTLYAIWSGIAGAEYEVAVVTSDLAPVTDGFLPVGDATEATVSGLDLRVGVRYLFVVRAREGDEVSPESVSDGVVVVVNTRPAVELSADPETLRQGSEDSAALTVRATDCHGLGHLTVEVLAPDGSALPTLFDEDVSGTSFDWDGAWGARDEAGEPRAAGIYEIRARAVDALDAEVVTSTTIEIVEGDDVATRWRARGDGCDCRTAGTTPTAGGCAWLATGAALVFARSRRRRPR